MKTEVLMGTLIYLTGAPATGKSTLGKHLHKSHKMEYISYSTELINHIRERDSAHKLDDIQIRQQSAGVVTVADVQQVDEKLIQKCGKLRQTSNVIIDRHPVTKENYGFRITG